MGFLLKSAATRLRNFSRFADRVAPGKPLTTALALQWATSKPTQRRATHAALLSTVRCFARYCAVFDPRTQIPPTHLLGPVYQRLDPHIYTKPQIGLLLRRARSLTTIFSPLHPLTYETLIGLLACTGMRPSEALRLQVKDLDAEPGCLRIAPCKSSSERIIPLHPTTVRALQRYRVARRRLFPFGEHLFVGVRGRPLRAGKADNIFQRLTRGLISNGQRRSLRLTDCRHTFASNWISEWSRQTEPVSHHLLLLARYLGHKDFSSTWWYVASDPKALQAAAKTFLRFHEKGLP
jgi:integrase